MTDNSKAVIDGSEIKTTLTRSEQRKKNRQDNKGQKKADGDGAQVQDGLFNRIYTFFVEAKEELMRVVWPTRKETIDSTWRLLILVIVAGIYLGLVDSVLTWLLGFVL